MTVEEAGNTTLMVFRLGIAQCAVPFEQVESVTRLPGHLHGMPGESPVFQHGGSVVSLIDLRFDPASAAPVLIARSGQGLVGYCVDEVIGLVPAAGSQWRPLPAGVPAGVFERVFLHHGQPVLLTSLRRLHSLAGRTALRAWLARDTTAPANATTETAEREEQIRGPTSSTATPAHATEPPAAPHRERATAEQTIAPTASTATPARATEPPAAPRPSADQITTPAGSTATPARTTEPPAAPRQQRPPADETTTPAASTASTARATELPTTPPRPGRPSADQTATPTGSTATPARTTEPPAAPRREPPSAPTPSVGREASFGPRPTTAPPTQPSQPTDPGMRPSPSHSAQGPSVDRPAPASAAGSTKPPAPKSATALRDTAPAPSAASAGAPPSTNTAAAVGRPPAASRSGSAGAHEPLRPAGKDGADRRAEPPAVVVPVMMDSPEPPAPWMLTPASATYEAPAREGRFLSVLLLIVTVALPLGGVALLAPVLFTEGGLSTSRETPPSARSDPPASIGYLSTAEPKQAIPPVEADPSRESLAQAERETLGTAPVTPSVTPQNIRQQAPTAPPLIEATPMEPIARTSQPVGEEEPALTAMPEEIVLAGPPPTADSTEAVPPPEPMASVKEPDTGDPPVTPKAEPITVPYTVRRGDTLWGIAGQHGDPWRYREFAEKNRIRNPDLIFPGETIVVPER